MKGSIFSKIARIVLILAAMAVTGAALPRSVQAASPFLSIVSVKAGEWVTVHATGLPANLLFTAKMDKIGTTADNGAAVGQTTSGASGTFDATYLIPTGLKNETSIAIRIDNDQGFYAYNWFPNQTTTNTTTVTPVPTSTTTPSGETTKLYIKVTAVEKNSKITVSATGFPANTSFTVRVGPYYTFGRDQQTMTTINSGNGGSFLFNVDLPAIVKDVSLVTVRVDSYSGGTHWVAYNAFTNSNMGTVNPTPTSPTPTPQTPAQTGCQIVSVTQPTSVAAKADFDVVWQIKNTSSKAWNQHEIDLRYQSGSKFFKYTGTYDLATTVKPGDTVKLTEDMTAPSTAGTYSATYVLIGDAGVVCSIPLTIVVK